MYASAKMSKFCGPLSAAASVLGMVDDGLNYKHKYQRLLIDGVGIALGVIATVLLPEGILGAGACMLASYVIGAGEEWAKKSMLEEIMI
ncbi:hypothetical protein [Clostridium felsineum]|uniref:Uncharacterized protein n=2 Tax=Clostridium felsineum TaxID=36839 RepID=A0A1S8L261_9CLOT|nr:hypothetical protein [Clostridium felsineum]URZ05301.1 hypothetical protein CLROS_006250 [Clostridium felsineum]URZ10342.1 hypothetical protein CROST_010500 [Clostridium felsineum]